MDCILCFIKKHRVATVLICIVVFALPRLIVHILFKWNSDNPWLAAEWSAGDVLGYIAGFESLIGTIALGIVTVYQSNKANEANERLAKENNQLQKISIQPLLPILKVDNLDIKNATHTRFDFPEEKACILNVSASITPESYEPHINVFMPHNTVPSQQFHKTVHLSLENISSGPITQITVDHIGFSGFKYQDQIVEKTVCTGLPGHNKIGWMILPNGSIDVCIDIYYDNEIFTNFWEFFEWNMIGSFDICLFLTNKSVSGLTYREQIYINKGANMKEHITYKAYEEEHPDT